MTEHETPENSKAFSRLYTLTVRYLLITGIVLICGGNWLIMLITTIICFIIMSTYTQRELMPYKAIIMYSLVGGRAEGMQYRYPLWWFRDNIEEYIASLESNFWVTASSKPYPDILNIGSEYSDYWSPPHNLTQLAIAFESYKINSSGILDVDTFSYELFYKGIAGYFMIFDAKTCNAYLDRIGDGIPDGARAAIVKRATSI